MYTLEQIQLLRNSDPGVLIPGIDTLVGNQTPQASLLAAGSLPSNGASITYDSVNNVVRITGNGLTISGYNFGSATVYVSGNNDTIANCNFTGTTGWYAVQVLSGSNTTITNCTFVGDPTSKNVAVIYSTGSVTVTNNSFINTTGNGIDAQGGGLISGNSFSGAGNDSGGSANAIWITNSSNPMTVSNNFISWTQNPAATSNTVNNCIRITGELGPVSNVTVTGNILLGGASTIQAIQVAGQGALTNVSITNNYIGFGTYYSFYPGSTTGITETGNVVFDWTNPAWSTSAWAAYSAAGLPTAYCLTGSSGSVSGGSAAGSVTLYGAGVTNLVMDGSATHETNYVGGFGSQTLWSSSGANIYTYLAVSDSTVASPDTIANFDPAKDVIDLSRIDGDLTASGVQTFTFIGSAAFDGNGPEVRTQQNANGTTSVQAALAGDTTADMQINITGLVNLTSANFALTAAQSATDMANGAAVSDALAPSTAWPLAIYNEANVQGRAYTSFAEIWSGSYLVADDLNLSASTGEIDILGPSGFAYTAMTIAKGGGTETVTSDGKTASLTFHQTETIQAGSAQAPETFAFSSGFGNETINGFATSGANADAIQFSTADFIYLTPGMTQAQDLAAVLANATPSATGAIITDSHGDSLALTGVSLAALAANPGLISFNAAKYTNEQIQLLRNSDPGVLIPGIDTLVGNQTPQASLLAAGSLPSNGASITYDSVNNVVRITGNGLTISGYNFGSATVYVSGNNDTIANCNFTGTTGWYAVQVLSGSNTNITNCTFVGDPTSKNTAVVYSTGSVSIINNSFINSPNDCIDVQGGGLISGNYFSGAGNDDGGHADAIWITNSSNPMTVSNNFISWTQNPAATSNTVNNCIRITGELGPVSNVTVTGNILLGGASSVQAIQIAGEGALTNVSITNNYIGFGTYYSFYPGSTTGITETGNVVFDWTNPAWSTSAWAAYSAAGLPTAYCLTGSSGSVSGGSAAGSVTLYGAGVTNLAMDGSATHETNYVGGFGSQTLWSSSGANIYTYLAVSDSTVASPDTIANFDPAKDVIDLSRIDGDLTASGVQTFTFIGSAAFDGNGPEVRTQQNANGTTSVQAALAGDTTADMQINITGLVNLTSANFALTAAQSATDMANGAAVSDALAPSTAWPLAIYNEANVQGRAYTSFAEIWSGCYLVADDLNLSASTGEIDILGPSGIAYTAMTIARGGGTETVASDGKTASLTFHQTETIQAGSAQAPETFALSSGFGNETINGFATSGANADLIQLRAADFSYLTPGMTQVQELAAVLLNASCGSTGTTIADSHGDSLMLAGISAATLSANPGLVKFV